MSKINKAAIVIKLKKPLPSSISSKTNGVMYVTKKVTLFSVTSASMMIFFLAFFEEKIYQKAEHEHYRTKTQ